MLRGANGGGPVSGQDASQTSSLGGVYLVVSSCEEGQDAPNPSDLALEARNAPLEEVAGDSIA